MYKIYSFTAAADSFCAAVFYFELFSWVTSIISWIIAHIDLKRDKDNVQVNVLHLEAKEAMLQMFPVLMVCAHILHPCENSNSLNLGWNKTCVCTWRTSSLHTDVWGWRRRLEEWTDNGRMLLPLDWGSGWGTNLTKWFRYHWQLLHKTLTLSWNCLSKAINHDSFVHHESSARGFGSCRSRWVYYHFLCLRSFFFFF